MSIGIDLNSGLFVLWAWGLNKKAYLYHQKSVCLYPQHGDWIPNPVSELPRGIESIDKYWISKLVFKTLKKYWILPKCTLGIEKVWKFYMEKKSQVSERNFTEGKAIRYLCNVLQCVKLSFMVKNFEKWREVMVLNFSNFVLKRYWKSMENEF